MGLPMMRVGLLGLCALMLALAGAARAERTVTVFAAASLKTALDEVIGAYADATGQSVVASYAGSSALARQIQFGAPADLYISANVAWMDWLQDQGLLAGAQVFDVVSNRLVLIAGADQPRALNVTAPQDWQAALQDGYLAMAQTSAVPAGIYGKAALQSLGVWDALAGRVAQTDNVRAALRLVATGEAPLGIVYATDARAEARVRVVHSFAEDSHPPIRYPAALITDTAEARAFLDHVLAADARDVFLSHGFLPPKAAP